MSRTKAKPTAAMLEHQTGEEVRICADELVELLDKKPGRIATLALAIVCVRVLKQAGINAWAFGELLSLNWDKISVPEGSEVKAKSLVELS